jgi:hypothetical protein
MINHAVRYDGLLHSIIEKNRNGLIFQRKNSSSALNDPTSDGQIFSVLIAKGNLGGSKAAPPVKYPCFDAQRMPLPLSQ